MKVKTGSDPSAETIMMSLQRRWRRCYSSTTLASSPQSASDPAQIRRQSCDSDSDLAHLPVGWISWSSPRDRSLMYSRGCYRSSPCPCLSLQAWLAACLTSRRSKQTIYGDSLPNFSFEPMTSLGIGRLCWDVSLRRQTVDCSLLQWMRPSLRNSTAQWAAY